MRDQFGGNKLTYKHRQVRCYGPHSVLEVLSQVLPILRDVLDTPGKRLDVRFVLFQYLRSHRNLGCFLDLFGDDVRQLAQALSDVQAMETGKTDQ